MRRRTVVFIAWLGGCAAIGCNLILGSESATFDPNVGPGNEGGTGDGPTADSPSPPDGGGDAMLADANPCTSTDTNPKHCGTCGHDCLGGTCAGGRCQPFVLVNESGNALAIAVDATHVYWTNEAAGDVRRAPIAGGAKEVVFDGPAGTSLGRGLVRAGGHVYFTVGDDDGGVYRCPSAGCGTAAPEVVAAPLLQPGFVGLADDGGTLLIAESTSGGRVARCTLPCTGALDVVGPSEGFPVYVTADGDDVYWQTILPAGGTLRARPAGAGAPITIKTSAFATEIAIAGSEIVYSQLGVGPVAILPDGGGSRRLDSTSAQSERLTVDKGTVYFNDSVGGSTGRIRSCGIAGCGDAGVVLAKDQKRPYAIVVDAKSIYWTNQGENDAGASVMRLAK